MSEWWVVKSDTGQITGSYGLCGKSGAEAQARMMDATTHNGPHRAVLVVEKASVVERAYHQGVEECLETVRQVLFDESIEHTILPKVERRVRQVHQRGGER